MVYGGACRKEELFCLKQGYLPLPGTLVAWKYVRTDSVKWCPYLSVMTCLSLLNSSSLLICLQICANLGCKVLVPWHCQRACLACVRTHITATNADRAWQPDHLPKAEQGGEWGDHLCSTTSSKMPPPSPPPRPGARHMASLTLRGSGEATLPKLQLRRSWSKILIMTPHYPVLG